MTNRRRSDHSERACDAMTTSGSSLSDQCNVVSCCGARVRCVFCQTKRQSRKRSRFRNENDSNRRRRRQRLAQLRNLFGHDSVILSGKIRAPKKKKRKVNCCVRWREDEQRRAVAARRRIDLHTRDRRNITFAMQNASRFASAAPPPLQQTDLAR